jgi:hypothetical protein
MLSAAIRGSTQQRLSTLQPARAPVFKDVCSKGIDELDSVPVGGVLDAKPRLNDIVNKGVLD